MSKGRILVADDESIITQSLQKVLSGNQFEVIECNSGDQFHSMIEEIRPNLILLDIYYGTHSGIDLLRKLRQDGNRTPVIMMTAFADVKLAVQAMKEGASDFITKPFDLNHLIVMVERIMEYSRLQNKVILLQEELQMQQSSSGILGNSGVLKHLLQTAERFAQSDNTTVLIEGESGTGKELFARFIHQRGVRSEKPFITINCGAIPKDLAESEFFGYEKGAFTGATEKTRQGRFELADTGTLLLDEVGELSLDMQVKLLRVLEEKRFYRLGGSREIRVDVRVIAATNRDLYKEVLAGRFREDLYYRLNVATLRIPPLRARTEDIETLVLAFLGEFSGKFAKPVPILSPSALAHLKSLPWKGNVRELRNAIERVVLLNDAEVLTTDHFRFLSPAGVVVPAGVQPNENGFVLMIPPAGVKMKDVLRELIMKTLAITNGNQVRAAKILGLTRSKLRYRMDQLDIQAEQRSYKINDVVDEA